MTTMTTREDIKVGLKEIDDQHREYFRLVQNLAEHRSRGESREMVIEALDAMSEYVFLHFSTEDRIMKGMDYPQLMVHHELHAVFVHKLIEFNRDFRAEKCDLGEEMLTFLERWFVDHILSEDVKYVKYLKGQQPGPC